MLPHEKLNVTQEEYNRLSTLANIKDGLIRFLVDRHKLEKSSAEEVAEIVKLPAGEFVMKLTPSNLSLLVACRLSWDEFQLQQNKSNLDLLIRQLDQQRQTITDYIRLSQEVSAMNAYYITHYPEELRDKLDGSTTSETYINLMKRDRSRKSLWDFFKA